MTLRRRHMLTGLGFLAPTVIILSAVGLFPLGYLIDVSLRNYNLAGGSAQYPYVGMHNFGVVLHDPIFWHASMVTVEYALIALPAEAVLGLWLAMLLNRKGRGERVRKLAKVVLIFPLMITPVVAGLFWNLMLNPQFGVVDYLLGAIGLPHLTWLSTPYLALMSVVGVDVWTWTPFFMLIFSSALAVVPQEQEEAALMDGANRWDIFRRVYWPYLRPGFTAALIIHSADIIRNFGMIFTLTNGGPAIATQTLSLYIRRMAFKIFNLGDAATMSVFALIITIILSRLYIRMFYQDISAT